MSVPPVLNIEALTPDLIDDLREACQAYCSAGYTLAFDELFTLPERSALINDFLRGDVPAGPFAASIREWLLQPWGLELSHGDGQMKAISQALNKVRGAVAAFSDLTHLDEADTQHLREMAAIFRALEDASGVGRRFWRWANDRERFSRRVEARPISHLG